MGRLLPLLLGVPRVEMQLLPLLLGALLPVESLPPEILLLPGPLPVENLPVEMVQPLPLGAVVKPPPLGPTVVAPLVELLPLPLGDPTVAPQHHPLGPMVVAVVVVIDHDSVTRFSKIERHLMLHLTVNCASLKK